MFDIQGARPFQALPDPLLLWETEMGVLGKSPLLSQGGPRGGIHGGHQHYLRSHSKMSILLPNLSISPSNDLQENMEPVFGNNTTHNSVTSNNLGLFNALRVLQ